MGREVKRVSLHFSWPLGKTWLGYIPDHPLTDAEAELGAWMKHPPAGPGYQLWENTTEGSPKSPVFETPEQLAGWCAENTTTWGHCRASKEEWLQMIQNGHIYGRLGNIIGL
jgi:hypothetical protein